MADDFSQPEAPEKLSGKLLIADPSLREGIFHKSVILLTGHSAKEGAFGLILNHPTGKVVGDFLNGVEFESLKNIPVHAGGPVLHEQMTFSSFWWSKKLGLRWALRISAEEAAAHARRPGRIVRSFLGYSGWGEGQLESEIHRNSWFVANPQPDILGQAHDNSLWNTLLSSMSPLHRILAAAPQNPLLN
ncbi:MAG: YqgE/AlgH family protein [Gloeobacteraceae cyanobacterium ES-bin-144]|nr:YqgE/AlgH family protein [Verrucomicrobiales bacterium]